MPLAIFCLRSPLILNFSLIVYSRGAADRVAKNRGMYV